MLRGYHKWTRWERPIQGELLQVSHVHGVGEFGALFVTCQKNNIIMIIIKLTCLSTFHP